jgi:hypothetical protein
VSSEPPRSVKTSVPSSGHRQPIHSFQGNSQRWPLEQTETKRTGCQRPPARWSVNAFCVKIEPTHLASPGMTVPTWKTLRRNVEPSICVWRRKLPSGKDRLHDFETVRNPVDARQQCSLVHARSWCDGEPEDDLRLYSWLAKTHERERIADFGEVVLLCGRKHNPTSVPIRPSRAIREADLAPHRQLPAGLTHLPHCGGYAVRIFEIEGRKPLGRVGRRVTGLGNFSRQINRKM